MSYQTATRPYFPPNLTQPTERSGLLDAIKRKLGVVRAHRFGHGEEPMETATDVEADVLAKVREQARDVHERLAHEHGVYSVELAGSTGGGKTLLLERLIERAPIDEEIGVIVGDVAGEDDARRLRSHGVAVENVNTGKECHLDPNLVSEALGAFDLDALDTLYLENVGNMVCPADFPLGANRRVLVVSTTEGDDVVRKHPMLVQSADVVVINKIDLAEAVDADIEQIHEDVEAVAPESPVLGTNAREGVGVADLARSLEAGRDEHGNGGHGHDAGHVDDLDHRHGHDAHQSHSSQSDSSAGPT